MKNAITLLVTIETRACHVTSGTPHFHGTTSISPPRPVAAEQANKTHIEQSRNASSKGGNCMNGLCQNPHRRLSPSDRSAKSRSQIKPPIRPLATERRPASRSKSPAREAGTFSIAVSFDRMAYTSGATGGMRSRRAGALAASSSKAPIEITRPRQPMHLLLHPLDPQRLGPFPSRSAAGFGEVGPVVFPVAGDAGEEARVRRHALGATQDDAAAVDEADLRDRLTGAG